MSRNRKDRRSTQASPIRFAGRLSVEALDRRDLLTTVTPFLQGTAFLDTVGNGIRTNSASEVGLANATVKLEQGTTVLATTTTDVNGNYLFNSSNVSGGLTVGSTYTLVETPPTGYTNTNAQALSQVDSASVTAANTIQVTVANPNAVTATFTGPTSSSYDIINYTFNGAAHTTAPTQLNFNLSGGGVAANTATTNYCVGLTDDLTQGLNFPTVLDSQASLPNGGEIGYLYNQYGLSLPSTSQLPSAVQSFPTKDIEAGLQVAIWDLEYNNGQSSGTFTPTGAYNSSTNYTNVLAAASAFLADATGKSETLEILDASLTGTLPTATATPGGQSILAAETFNFGNTPKFSPTINTQQKPASATVGSSIADLATVTGNSPTGTVTFSLYNNSAGTGTALYTDTESLVNGSATSKGYTATATGTDYWVATYNGDSNNGTVTSGTASEPVTVTKYSPTINTQQQPATATVGTSIADLATVTGYNPTGAVTFSLYNNSNGTGTPLFTDTESLVNGSATSKGYTASPGTDYWVATYNGDSNNNSVTSGTASEPVTVNKGTPVLNTSPQPSTATVGTAVADKAQLVGGYWPTGTFTFNLYSNANGTGTPVFTDTESQVNGGATSASYTATTAGNYSWVVTYNGDSNNNVVTSPAANEPLTVTKYSPAINTQQQPATATVGTSIADKATVTGYNPTGSVTFNLYSNSAGTGTALFTDTETLSGGSATSKGYVATASATDYWVATYNGDSNNSTVTSGTASEPVAVTKYSPTINTVQQPSVLTVGGTTGDEAIVTGYNPTGTVTFSFSNNAAGTNPYLSVIEPVINGVANTPAYATSSTGVYYWGATYNGDSNNAAVSSPASAEPVTINKAAPAINTQQQPAIAAVGTSIADLATVTGGYNPTGTVTFSLYSNANGTGTALFTDTETLSGGSATSKGYIASAIGTDYWVATYNGDSNNKTVTSGTASEPVSITPKTSISGTKYQDTTGNGLCPTTNAPLAGDIPEAGVTINLYNNVNGTPVYVESTVTASDGTYSFSNLPYGSYFVAETVPSGQTQTGPYQTASTNTSSIGDCSFQSKPVSSGCYAYNPSGANWTYWGQSGVSGNGSAFTSGNPSAPLGNDVAFVQCQGSISQEVSNWTAGNYQLSYSSAQRGNWGVSNEDFEILVDGNIVATCKPTGTSYQTYTTPSFYVGSGSHTISFQGLDSCGGDNTALLDNVCLVQNSGTVTESNGLATYTINLSSSSPSSTNNNFSDYFQCNTSAITNVSYKVNGWGPYSSLSGVTSQSSTVSATFTVTGSSSQMVTLVSYAVPYYGAPLTSQVEYSVDTGTFTPGVHTVSVTLPCGYYQVDFVCGAAITQFGPSSSNDTYHGENRYISSDNAGWQNPSYTTPPLANVQSDIGSVAAPGTLSYTNGTYTVTADGNDIWNNSDAFNYVYQTLDGDGEIIAKVAGITSTDSWAKAGLMIRQSLAANSAQASVFATPGNGVAFQDRETTGASSNNWGASNSYGCNSTTSVYLKLVRMGSTITGYDSHDGVNWTEVGTDTVNMTGTVYIGLATSSHAVNVTATYTNVNTSGYYCSNSGQSLIQGNGGWSGSTSLSTWLASNYGNLYGSNAGSCNLWGMNNNQVASFCQSLESQWGSESLECQTLYSALDEYFSNWSWGGSAGSQAGFNVSWSGYGSTTVSTGSDCSAFGGASSISVWNMLGDINNQSWGSSLYNGNTVYHQQAYSCVTWACAWL